MEKNKLFNMLQYVIFAFQITRTMLTNDEQKPGRKTEPKNHFVEIPSGKRLHNYGKIHHVQWENPLFLWPFSMGITTSPCFVRKAGPGTFFFRPRQAFGTSSADVVVPSGHRTASGLGHKSIRNGVDLIVIYYV